MRAGVLDSISRLQKEVERLAELIVRRAEARDAEAIAELEKVCFSQPWSYESIYHDVAENKLSFYLAAETEGKVIGYAGIWNIAGEGHITNVAVSPEYRRKGVGDALMEVMLKVTEESGVLSHTLEVRKSNAGALRLYEKHGFKIAGERKGYYEDNGEDALIMWRRK
ncbi:MAG: ribosomal protein S18-alanine N-acetyltransferase [Firmicutes bacterium]|nr:ribosomal protein S18-alanine N-acetyltransferase [Bacillota bacterium]